jgi:hypothetical protein
MSQMRTLKLHKQFEPLLCEALGRARLQHGLEASTVYCESGNMLENDKVVLNLPALN